MKLCACRADSSLRAQPLIRLSADMFKTARFPTSWALGWRWQLACRGVAGDTALGAQHRPDHMCIYASPVGTGARVLTAWAWPNRWRALLAGGLGDSRPSPLSC